MIVDDSALVRETLTAVLGEADGIEVLATAANPIIAMKKMAVRRPDVMILDIEMPRMDGLTFLQKIMSEDPLPVIICSSKSENGSQNALRALEYGAVEIIQKPKVGTKQFFLESQILILDAVKAARQAGGSLKRLRAAPAPGRRGTGDSGSDHRGGGGRVPAAPAGEGAETGTLQRRSADVILPPPAAGQIVETTEKVVVVGASTGGTEALRLFLEAMPRDCPPIVIVQHMPEKFTSAFAARLNSICTIEVAEARDGDSVLRGRALIAPGNRHSLLKRSGARYYVVVKEGPLVSRHRPSVDVLFRSAARYGGRNIIAVIMTGMGNDGAKGMQELKTAGAYTIAQDEASCIVFGMPAEAIKLGAVDDVLGLDHIAPHVLRRAALGQRG
jgi:two-component system chemotaxis response regulator CheB